MKPDVIPFSFVKTVVVGDLFIGRQEPMRMLESYVRSRSNTYVVGLPRMGKTSLVKQCFCLEENQNKWIENDRLVPIYISVDTSRDAASLWKSIARRISIFLKKRGEHYGILDGYLYLEKADDIFQVVLTTLETIYDELGLSFIIILDEFDGVRNYPKSDNVFQKIRSLNEFGVVVTCSRRTPEHIEMVSAGTRYFTDSGKQIFVGLFNDNDVMEYWERFKQYFPGFSTEQFDAYKKLVKRYVGNHPMLMSLMNHWICSSGKGINEVWNLEKPVSQREDFEREIRVKIREVFLRQIEYVEEQGLKTAAIQLVVGTSRAIPDEEVDLLLKYQFIQTVSVKEKARFLGYDLGPTTSDLKKRYICFSELTTHIMKDLYDPEIKGFELLREVELKLREVITRFLWDICGKDPFHCVTGNDEPWEIILENRIACFKNNTHAHNNFLKALGDMRRIKKQRAEYECKPSFDRSLINEVTSTTLGQLWNVFIRWQWREYFSRIFSSYNGKNDWYDNVFQPILEWRNAADHHNDDELPDHFVEYASSQAHEVIKDIKLFLTNKTIQPERLSTNK